MTLRLTVDRDAWEAHVHGVANAVDGLVPVVKGNGYGFGRAALATRAAELARLHGGEVAVGTVFEAADVPAGSTAVVLAPHLGPLPASLRPTSVLCVGSEHHAAALVEAGWAGRVHLKVRSSMNRYGVAPGDVDDLAALVRAAGLRLAGLSVHLPLAGGDDDRLAEIEALLGACDPSMPLSVSHLATSAFRRMQERHPDRVFRLRVGTALWHGDKSTLRLEADVVDVHPIRAGERAGYRLCPAPIDGALVLVGAGSAHGIVPLGDGRSPLHFARQRMPLLEPPHMHTTAAIVPDGQPCPAVGDWVDVQRPLTMVTADEVVWR